MTIMPNRPGLRCNLPQVGAGFNQWGGASGGGAYGQQGGLRGGDVGEEVVALVVDDDEGGEVADLDTPDRLHPELGVLEHLDPGDALFRQLGRRAADGAQVEAAMPLARLRHGG